MSGTAKILAFPRRSGPVPPHVLEAFDAITDALTDPWYWGAAGVGEDLDRVREAFELVANLAGKTARALGAPKGAA